jgi:hypothetical protein
MPLDMHHSNTLDFVTESADRTADTVTAAPPPVGHSAEAVYGSCSVLMAPAGKAAEPQVRDVFPLFGGFLSLGIICLLLSFSRHVRSFLGLLATSLFSFRRLEKQYKENSLFVAVTTRIMLGFAIISIGFGSWLLWPFHLVWDGQIAPAPAYVLAILTGGIGGFLLLKMLLLYAIEYVSQSKEVMHTILYFGRFYLIAYGFLLFPVSLLMVATPSGAVFNMLIIITLVITGLFLLLYFLRIIQILLNARVSIFFLILYLCTLEISPFILLYGFLSIS